MKEIHSSNLMLRFYARDGWTKEELDECCIQGEVVVAHPKDTPNHYYVLDHEQCSRFDAEKLLEKASKVIRTFDDWPDETDEEFVTRYNWC